MKKAVQYIIFIGGRRGERGVDLRTDTFNQCLYVAGQYKAATGQGQSLKIIVASTNDGRFPAIKKKVRLRLVHSEVNLNDIIVGDTQTSVQGEVQEGLRIIAAEQKKQPESRPLFIEIVTSDGALQDVISVFDQERVIFEADPHIYTPDVEYQCVEVKRDSKAVYT